MKISEMIACLQEVMAEHGDLACAYAEDDEGNGYHLVNYPPSVMFCESVGSYLVPEEEGNCLKVCVVN